MATERRRAFTLVEMLVVISIIGVMMALILPAVVGGREAGRQLECANKEKQMALAMIAYHSANGQFPGYVNVLQSTANTASVSWMVMLMPFIDRNDVWQTWTAPGPLDTPFKGAYIDLFVCPSNPPNVALGGRFGYAVNAGYGGQEFKCEPPFNNEKMYDGVFFFRGECSYGGNTPSTKMFPYMTLQYLSSNDGAAKTLMLSENNQLILCNTNTTQPNAPPVWNSLTYNTAMLGYGKKELGFTYWGSAYPTQRKINIHKQAESILLSRDYARPSSFHVGGVNVAFCDGHVKFLAETVDWDVFKELVTSAGQFAAADQSKPWTQVVAGGEYYYIHTILDEGRY